MKKFLVVSGLCLLTITSAVAEAPSRFVFKDIEGGVMRLDTTSGQVSHCLREHGQMVCRSVADDRQPLDDENARLRRENAELKAQLAKQPKVSLPTEQEVDQALSLAERYLRRMMQFFKSEQESGKI